MARKQWAALAVTGVLGLALPLPGLAVVQSAQAAKATMVGRLAFVNDQGSAMIDVGSDQNGWQKFGVKLWGVAGKDGLKNAVTKLVPLGTLVKVEIMKTGSVPEVVIRHGARSVNDMLRKQGFAAK